MEKKDLLRKARAGFISSVVFCIIAFCYWPGSAGWIVVALLSGFVAGYICYDLKEFYAKSSVAWLQTKIIMAQKRFSCPKKLRRWASKEHPVLYLWPFGMTIFYTGSIMLLSKLEVNPPAALVFFSVAFAITLSGLCWCSFDYFKRSIRIGWSNDKSVKVSGYGRILIPLTYKNIFLITCYGLWDWLVSIKSLLGEILIFLVIFPKKLAILINHRERVSCSVTGLVGGIIMTNFFAPQAFMSQPYIFGVFCGGLLGAGLVIAVNQICAKLVAKWESQENKVLAG